MSVDDDRVVAWGLIERFAEAAVLPAWEEVQATLCEIGQHDAVQNVQDLQGGMEPSLVARFGKLQQQLQEYLSACAAVRDLCRDHQRYFGRQRQEARASG